MTRQFFDSEGNEMIGVKGYVRRKGVSLSEVGSGLGWITIIIIIIIMAIGMLNFLFSGKPM